MVKVEMSRGESYISKQQNLFVITKILLPAFIFIGITPLLIMGRNHPPPPGILAVN